MAVNKNFVVKNGLEVSTDLILADADRNKVGIGSTTPRTELDVRGGIAATDISVSGVGTIVTLQSTTGTVTNLGGTNLNYSGIGTIGNVLASNANVSGITTTTSLDVSGIATVAVGIVTNLRGTNLNYSGIATANSISIGATQVISNERQLQNIVSLDATTTATIESAIANAPNTFADLNVTGISTLGTVLISSGVITATSGVVTYYGDGAYLQNISAGVGIGTSTGLVGYGVTFINFFGPGVSTAYYNPSVGIATIYFSGGGGSASIGIGETPGDAGFGPGIVTTGNLWYNTNLGRLFIYYNDGDSAQWVDAAPFNIGVLSPVSIALTSGTAVAPSLYFSGDTSTGLFQATPGQQTFVSSGAAILNVNPGGVNVTGVATATSFSGSLTGNVTGTAGGLSGTPNITVGNITSGNINSSGIVTATTFSGSLTGNVTGNATGLSGNPSITVTNATVNGVLSVGGTTVILNAATLQINDRDITLGVTTDALGNNVANDITANHGGISVASTVGTPIINIPTDGVNSDLPTNKQIMWVKQNHYSGLGTDAWVFNYGVSIGNTATVQNGSRLTVGTGFTVYDAGNVSAGAITATSFSGNGANLTGLSIPAGFTELDSMLFG